MKLVLVYAPFCAPTIAPYSITYLKDFLKVNADIEVVCLDLNAKFHKLRFSEFYERIKTLKKSSVEEYGFFLDGFVKESRPVYSQNHKSVVSGKKPELFSELLDSILEEKPDFVAFSLVYSSQAFYARELVLELKKKGIQSIVGGPAVNSIISKDAVGLRDEFELLEFLKKQGARQKNDFVNSDVVLDFSCFLESDYLSKERIIPIKTSKGCFYKQCAFCTHHNDEKYGELNLDFIKKTILHNDLKRVFFIDDMISKKRLSELSILLKDADVRWWCQLRPTADLKGSLKPLAESGLASISWGVESGSQRVLDSMRKGTRIAVVKELLLESHSAGIKNIVFMLFGFPGETKEEFMQSLDFLKENKESLDLVSTSVFGLQKDSFVFKNPELYGITRVDFEKRSVLDEKITYALKTGLSSEEAKELRKRYILSIKKINKLPKVFNYLKEQTLVV
jgi:hypothetical protein